MDDEFDFEVIEPNALDAEHALDAAEVVIGGGALVAVAALLDVVEPDAEAEPGATPGALPPTPAEHAAQLLARGDLRGDSLMLGRDAEAARLVRLLAAGRSAVLTGEHGVGKSWLLCEAFEVLTGQRRRLDPATGRELGRGGERAAWFWI